MGTNGFGRFLKIAQGSLEETKYHLLLAKDLEYISNETYSELSFLADDVGKMLYGLIKKLKTQ